MPKQPTKKSLGFFIFSAVLTAVLFPTLMLSLAADWNWLEGWLFALWIDTMILSSIIRQYVKDPDLLNERLKPPGSGNQLKPDTIIQSLLYLLGIGWLVILPLDERLSWSPSFPIWLKVIGGILLLPSLYFLVKSSIDNTYLSTGVRIQAERKHRVVDTGTYSFVRHPFYLGFTLMFLGGSLLLGSLVGLIIAVVVTGILVIRIIEEEKFLVNELEGYREYKKKVRYRLIPFIW
jgi:protein-S-isoprenylcysteine O-methyltransferase Ste14